MSWGFSASCRSAWGLESCSTAHYCARETKVLDHEVRLMAPRYVKRQKNDMLDAEAIREAMSRPAMRNVL
jgi:transposase